MECSAPGSPVPHYLPEFAQIHVLWVSDAIKPSHPLPPHSVPAFNLSQHQGLFQWVGSCVRWPMTSASVLPMNIQDWFLLGWTGLISLKHKGLSRVFSSPIIGKHQFFETQPSLRSNSHICTWLLEKPLVWLHRPLKRPGCWERLRAGGEGDDKDEMVGWHHWLDGREFEQAPRVGDGQGSLACCSPWGLKELHTTVRLNWTEEISTQ